MASDSFGRNDLATAFDAIEAETSAASGLSSSHVELGDNVTDYFVERDGQKFAGTHLLIDLWGATNLDNQPLIEKALTEAAVVAGATILHVHLKKFTENGGVSGVIVLAESHISIHTWPERGFAALDVFMCGACRPEKAIPIFEKAFKPKEVVVDEQRRGVIR